MYVELMKNFLLADSSELMAVRLISASWAQNVWFLLSRHDVLRGWWKIFISPIRASFWLLDSFRPPEPKNVWFLLSGHDEKFTYDSSFWLLDSCFLRQKNLLSWLVQLMKNSSELMAVRLTFFGSGGRNEPKNVWFLLSRHDVRRVDEKFSTRRFEGADGC